jgi:hypothetical protein
VVGLRYLIRRPGSDDREQPLAVLPVTARSMYEMSTRPATGEPAKQHVRPCIRSVTDEPFLNRVSQV